MKSGKEFIEFIKKMRQPAVLLFLALGIVLLLLSGSFFEEAESDRQPVDELSELCSSVDGVGRCRVMVTYGDDGEVYAAAVLCDGAESVSVREKLSRLIASLYGIGYNRISILKISE